jgi:hypothetical protein
MQRASERPVVDEGTNGRPPFVFCLSNPTFELGVGPPGQAPQDFNSSRFFCERVDHIAEAGRAFFAGGARAYAKYIMLCLRQRAPHYV